MGGRYCAINSPRGSRWGQKSRDRRSSDFCPHRGPSGELIAQYRPPMSFCFYPTLYLGNHLYFLKPDSSWKQQKNTRISEIDSVHSTKRVVMVKPQHLLYIDPHTSVHLFADDCLLYRSIRSMSDKVQLQCDLDALSKWGDCWGLHFNVNKCHIMQIANSTGPRFYELKNVVLSEVKTAKYLGVLL